MGEDGRGSFNLCTGNEWNTVKVWNCNKFFIKSSIHERSLIEFETRFLSISNTFLLFPYTWSKINPIHEFSFPKRTYLLNNNQIPPSSNPPLLPPPLPYPLPSLIIGAKNCTPIEVLAPKRNGRKSGDIVSTQRYVAR